MALNISGVVKNLGKTSIYTPIIEAIVNSIDAIQETKRSDGKIIVKLLRDEQTSLQIDQDEIIPPIRSIEISDNGSGFTESNIKAFDTLYTDFKINKGGKGFGRFTFLKYFSHISYISTSKDDGKFQKKSFKLGRKTEILENLKRSETSDTETGTTLKLEGISDENTNKLEKKADTIARRLVEKLLIFFISDTNTCPQIILRDDNTGEVIELNDYAVSNKEILPVGEKTFTISKDESKQQFHVKVFKLYYSGNESSSVILSAHSREVTQNPLHHYISEFKDEFYDITDGDGKEKIKKNYTIRTYVQGKYLDNNVSLERSGFTFPKKQGLDLLTSISQEEIETKATEITQGFFKEDVKSRQDKKIDRINKYVNENAPWHRPYINSLDLTKIPYDSTEVDIESALHKERFFSEQMVKNEVTKLLSNDESFDPQIVVGKLSEMQKADLAHYVVLRKHVLDLFNKSLNKGVNGKYNLEKQLHDLIFPRGGTSEKTPYESHNLWLIDERLSFHNYVASDKKLEKTADRPDILLFDRAILAREGNEISNPIFVFEFKRPQRKEYKDDEDPIKQVQRYVDQIRKGKYVSEEGRNIYATEETPAYGFIICDLSDKIKEFCRGAQLVPSPDQQAYYGYHSTYKIYFEVVSFDKLLKDSELRNRIFFKKLGIV